MCMDFIDSTGNCVSQCSPPQFQFSGTQKVCTDCIYATQGSYVAYGSSQLCVPCSSPNIIHLDGSCSTAPCGSSF